MHLCEELCGGSLRAGVPTLLLLGIPTVLDRTIQQAISQVINPTFDYYFSNSSFGFRPARNCHQAVRQIRSYIREGYRIAVDVDLESLEEALLILPLAV